MVAHLLSLLKLMAAKCAAKAMSGEACYLVLEPLTDLYYITPSQAAYKSAISQCKENTFLSLFFPSFGALK